MKNRFQPGRTARLAAVSEVSYESCVCRLPCASLHDDIRMERMKGAAR